MKRATFGCVVSHIRTIGGIAAADKRRSLSRNLLMTRFLLAVASRLLQELLQVLSSCPSWQFTHHKQLYSLPRPDARMPFVSR